ncbi:hypothetical protein RAF77_23685, partial [Klebsiella pneumoniae]
KACVLPENPASYRVVRTKSYLFNKAHGPVNVPIPVLIGPSWNGSGSGYNSATSSSGSGS